MTDAEATPAAATDGHDQHDSGHGHEPAGEPLGPPDLLAWAYVLGGGAIGLMVAAALYIAGQT